MFTGAGTCARKENATGVIHTMTVQNPAWHNFYGPIPPNFSPARLTITTPAGTKNTGTDAQKYLQTFDGYFFRG
jgi:hypothetical protein